MNVKIPVFLLFLISVPAFADIKVAPVDGITLTLSSQVTPIPLNQMHNWIISLHSASGAAIEDASILLGGGMPQHDHGLATNPRVTRYLGEGRYLIEGIRFHMPGAWLMEIQVDHNGQRYRSEATLQL